jgi:uncharacterized protein YndB with AHSA1/START domain
MIHMPELCHSLTRTVVIRARRDAVFRYFTDDARWAGWWGKGSTIDPRPGGRVLIRYPNGVEVTGEVLEIAAPERILFTYGYASGTPIAPGGSRVSIRLEAIPAGTRLHLEHQLDDASTRDAHVQGWRYQMAVFGNVVMDELNAQAAERVDAWFSAWSQPDAALRNAVVERITSPDITFRDRFSLVAGLADLLPHLEAVHRFMPGIGLRREGAVRHCQGTVLADWVARGAAGEEKGRGTNVFELGPDGLIETVVGIWNVAAQA